MKNKYLFIIPLIVAMSCALHNGKTISKRGLPSLEDQCKLLSQKQSSDSKPIKTKRFRVNKSNLNSINSQPKKYGETSETSLFLPSINTQALYASNDRDKVIFYPIANSENQTQSQAAESASSRDEKYSESKSIERISFKPASLTTIITERERKQNNTIPIALGTSALLSILLLNKKQRSAGKLSYWAAKNPWKTRAILTGSHITTGLGALTLGNQLFQEEAYVSDAVNYLSMAAFSTSALLYSSTNSFLQRKIHDTILFTSGTIMLISIGNQYAFTDTQSNLVFPTYRFSTPYQHIEIPTTNKVSNTEDTPTKRSTGEKIALTVLAVVLFGALAYGLAALSCSIACSGNEGLAAIVGIGGGIGLLALLVIALKSIFNPKPRKQKKATAASSS